MTNDRKAERLNSGLPDSLSVNTYNLIIGGCLLYGLIVNALIVWLCGDLFINMNYIVFLIGYFVLCLAGTFISSKSTNPAISFLGYNMVVVPIGAVLSVCLPGYAFKEILLAIIITACVIGFMTVLATTQPKLFSKMGTSLLIALLVGIVGELIAMLLGYSGNIFNWIFVILFTLYIGYDWHKAQVYPKTLDNAVDSALDLYLDIINLFIRLLDIIKRD